MIRNLQKTQSSIIAGFKIRDMAHDVTQHVSVSIKNNLTKGEIILQNLALLRYVY
jgi:hypothetical protein